MKTAKSNLSILALTAANLAPLAGVLFFGWDVAVLVLLYWTENVITGFYNVLKMILVKGRAPFFHFGKLFTIPFFCIHFGGFCAVHGFFLLAFFKLGGAPEPLFPNHSWPGPLVFLQLFGSVVNRLWQSRPPGMEWPVLFLFVSHGVSFVQNYLMGGEYASMALEQLMGQPYKRIVVLHVAIIAGAMPVLALGSPLPLLVILIALKIWMDIWLHIKSHPAVPPGKGGHVRRRKVEPADSKDV